VFWGRIHAQKGLGRALRLFAALRSIRTDVQFFVIGPDGGDMARICGLADELGLGSSVQFLGPMDFSQIREVAECASFYLQTSELEGMAMSVVEAMQLGLVPVVTPVGEIAQYARAGENAVVVTDDAIAVSELLALLVDERRYQTLRNKAIAYWLDKPLYKDDVLSACRELLGFS
jgi:glycosyltransferase involved in cell wall biosynthesis